MLNLNKKLTIALIADELTSKCLEYDANDLFDRIKYGLSDQDLQRARAGAAYVAKEHTWSHRIQEIYEVIGMRQ